VPSLAAGLVDERVAVASRQPHRQRPDDRAEGDDQPGKVDRWAATAVLRTASPAASASVLWSVPQFGQRVFSSLRGRVSRGC
jgi:hypothetical protein